MDSSIPGVFDVLDVSIFAACDDMFSLQGTFLIHAH